jgi:hypothetical protein
MIAKFQRKHGYRHSRSTENPTGEKAVESHVSKIAKRGAPREGFKVSGFKVSEKTRREILVKNMSQVGGDAE